MVSARVHRHAIEVIAKAPLKAQLRRQEQESALLDESTGGVARVHRHSVETLSKVPVTARLTRQEQESALLDESAGAPARVHRHGLEILAQTLAKAILTRQETESAVLDEATGVSARVHRHGIEVIAQLGVPPPQPLPFPAGLEFFLHNWVATARMQSSYQTTIERSSKTLAEERTGLLQRPARRITLELLHGDRAEVDRLYAYLRRMTGERLAVPLFQDAVVLTQSPLGQDRIFSGFGRKRYFNGARVAVFPERPGEDAVISSADIDTYIMKEINLGSIVLDRNLDREYKNGAWIAVPVMDLEIVLEPKLTQITDATSTITLDLDEVVGKSALPPTFTGGLVDGWQHQLGLPVFEPDPDWSSGIDTTYKRYGQKRVEGRKSVVAPEGDRYVQVQAFNLLLERSDFWDVLNLFDSRRGRLDAFFELDLELLWTVSDTDPQFVDVSPFGVFSDFRDDFTDFLGIKMNDGTIYIRQINSITLFGGSWRLGLVAGNDLPAIVTADIDRFSRARVKRFDADTFEEEWETTEVARTSFATIEVLNEAEFAI